VLHDAFVPSLSWQLIVFYSKCRETQTSPLVLAGANHLRLIHNRFKQLLLLVSCPHTSLSQACLDKRDPFSQAIGVNSREI
jgi:hypothetical protein